MGKPTGRHAREHISQSGAANEFQIVEELQASPSLVRCRNAGDEAAGLSKQRLSIRRGDDESQRLLLGLRGRHACLYRFCG